MAQQKSVIERVSNTEWGAMINVTVVVKGTNPSVQTNSDGTFSIQVAPGETLLFRAIGSGDASQTIGTGNIYNITLSNSDQNIDEVVVTVLGDKERKESFRICCSGYQG